MKSQYQVKDHLCDRLRREQDNCARLTRGNIIIRHDASILVSNGKGGGTLVWLTHCPFCGEPFKAYAK